MYGSVLPVVDEPLSQALSLCCLPAEAEGFANRIGMAEFINLNMAGCPLE